MKDDKYFFRFDLEPGKTLKKNHILKTTIKPLVSIITTIVNYNPLKRFICLTSQRIINPT